MAEQTVGGAVARQVPLEPVLAEMRPEFAKMLPAHLGPEQFERWCVTFLKGALGGKQADAWRKVLGNPAGQLSVMQAFLDCGSLGLEPGRTYHLVPFGDTVTGIIDYKGEVELIYRAGRMPVVAQLVREGDEFYMLGANVPPRHEADWFDPGRDDLAVVGGYAYCQMGPDLYSQVVHMTEAGFLKHKAKARTKNVWDEWPEAMRLKTLIHQLRKIVPWSAEVLP